MSDASLDKYKNVREKFKNAFSLPQKGFLQPKELQNIQVGFSVYKERDNKDFKSLFVVYIKNEHLNNLSPLKPLLIQATYGKFDKDNASIIIYSTEFTLGLNSPIELISENEYFYNIETNSFFDGVGNPVIAPDILLKIDSLHTKPERLFGGFWLRMKLYFFRSVLTFIIRVVFSIFAGLQFIVSGKKVTIYHDLTQSENRTRPTFPSELQVTKNPPIDIFGYKVETWIAILYSSFHLIAYLFFYKYKIKPLWLTALFKNSFLTLTYGIVTLGLANTILPKLLSGLDIFGWVLIKLQQLHWKAAVQKIKV